MKRLGSKTPDDDNLFLKRLLNDQGITAQELSKRTGISYERLCRTFQDLRSFTVPEIKTIARYLRIPDTDIIKYFFGGNVA